MIRRTWISSLLFLLPILKTALALAAGENPAPVPPPAASSPPTSLSQQVLMKPTLTSDLESSHIDGLSWNTNSIDIIFPPNEKIIAKIQGTLTRTDPIQFPIQFKVKGAKAAIKWGKPLPSSDTRSFELKLILQSANTSFTIEATSPTGELIGSEKKILSIPNWRTLSKKKVRRHILTASLGPSYSIYSETLGTANYTRALNQFSLVVKAAYNFVFAPPTWDLGVNVYLTALPLVSSATGIANPRQSMRFLGANLRLGYSMPFIKEPWKLTVLGGLFYTTTFAANGALGFSNQMGPQIFPTIRRIFSSGDAVYVYLKFAPIAKNGFLAFQGLDSREIAGGVGWVHPMKNGTPLSISFDYSNLGFTVPVRVLTTDVGLVTTTATFRSLSYSISVGMGL